MANVARSVEEGRPERWCATKQKKGRAGGDEGRQETNVLTFAHSWAPTRGTRTSARGLARRDKREGEGRTGRKGVGGPDSGKQEGEAGGAGLAGPGGRGRGHQNGRVSQNRNVVGSTARGRHEHPPEPSPPCPCPPQQVVV